MTAPDRLASGAAIREGSAGSYRLGHVIGRGGTSVVWRADRVADGVAVAVKVPRRSTTTAMEGIRREATLLAGLRDCPGVVPLLDLIDDDGGSALVLTLAAGGSLATVLEENGPWSGPHTRQLLHRLADTLARVHRGGLVHGDIKPGNLLLQGDGKIWLTDFDGAHRIDGAGAEAPRLRAVGTLGCAPPEVVRGDEATPAADVFGWGVIGLCCLTGQAPHAALHAGADPKRRAHPDDRSLIALLRQAIDPDPRGRPADGGELLAALRRPQARDRSDEYDHTPEASEAGAHGWNEPTIEVGPRPARDAAAGRRRPSRLERAALVAGAAAVSTGLVLALRATETTLGRTCAALPAPSPAVTVFDADTDGDGCAERLTWDPAQATLSRPLAGGPTQRLSLGVRGDQLLLGDWECRGVLTPATYHPADGTITRFSGWPASAADEVNGIADPPQVANGRAVVRRSAASDGQPACDKVVVQR
ncbi:MAG: serine/threonine protein kinase [Actinobacteria bacterium]|nr:serine/threonine protein kinase [Actinomycetota bacterium]